MLYILFTIALIITAHHVVKRLGSIWRRRSIIRKKGCVAPNRYPHTHLFGSDLSKARAEAVKAGRRNYFDLETFAKCGSTYEARQFKTKIIHTTETANFQAIGATQFQDFGRDVSGRRIVSPFFGHGILSMNGIEWKQTRDLVTPLFARAQLRDVEYFRKYADRVLDLIPRDGSTIDMQPLLQKLFLDSSTEFIFGESIDSLRDKSGASQEFLHSFNMALAGAGKRLNMGAVLSLTHMFDSTWAKNISKVHAFIDHAIARHAEKATTDDEERTDLSQRYILIDGMAKVIKDPVELRFQLLNVFFPARDTSAIAVSNALFFLARNPEIWQSLRADALTLNLGHQTPTFELLKGLSSFRHVLFEAIRLQGPSGQIRRVALCDTTLPRGGGPDGSSPLFVSKGTPVVLNNFPKYRDPKLWGEDVEAFRPSRFEGKVLGWEFTPFFGGPRICPALNQVIAQSVYLLVRLVLEFKAIENRDDVYEYVEATRMLVESKNGVKIALHCG